MTSPAPRSVPTRRRPLALLPALLAALLTACGGDGADGPRGKNLLVITVDTTRADHVGAYGSPLGLTPTIDGLAERGVLFETAYAPMAQTLPSHATMFTGLDPRGHGALENVYELADEQVTLAELCAEAGYATGAFIGAMAIDRATGIHQGFEHFDEPTEAGSLNWETGRKGHPPQRKAAEVTRAALAWAEQLDGERPFLLWAHYYDPHGDKGGGFSAPPRHVQAVDRDAVAAQVAARQGEFGEMAAGLDALTDFWRGYAGEIRYMDAQIGVLLEGLERVGRLEDTVIALVADHGEGLYEHGQKAHGTHLWEEQVAIPFVLVHPDGSAAGRRVAGLVELTDLLPSLLTMAFGPDHGRLPEGREGLDLWSLALAGQDLPDRAVVLERPHYSAERLAGLRRGQGPEQFAYGFKLALRRGDHKLLRWPEGSVQLFDLARDEAELVDRSGELPQVTAELEAELARWMRRRPVDPPGVVGEITDAKRAQLEALGYIGGEEDPLAGLGDQAQDEALPGPAPAAGGALDDDQDGELDQDGGSGG